MLWSALTATGVCSSWQAFGATVPLAAAALVSAHMRCILKTQGGLHLYAEILMVVNCPDLLLKMLSVNTRDYQLN